MLRRFCLWISKDWQLKRRKILKKEMASKGNIEEREDEFPKPLMVNDRFDNPWNVSKNVNFFQFAYASWKTDDRPNVPTQKELDQIPEMQICEVDHNKIKNPPAAHIQATWLGHAGFLIQLDGVNVLFDPVFSDTIGPISFIGKRRYRKCALRVEDLPDIDIVCISHNHYDHCDLPSLKKLHAQFGDRTRWCVPLNMDLWLRSSLAENIHILPFNWWDSKNVQIMSTSENTDICSNSNDVYTDNNDGKWVNIVCVPAQHWSIRSTAFTIGSMTDKNFTLWSGWIIKTADPNTMSVYHTGDTGYCQIFKSIGKKYGPIDLAMIPIGAYIPREETRFQHVNPDEAVQIHEDVKAEHSLAMHWGTFTLTQEFFLEPPRKLEEALKRRAIPLSVFQTLKHGQTVAYPVRK